MPALKGEIPCNLFQSLSIARTRNIDLKIRSITIKHIILHIQSFKILISSLSKYYYIINSTLIITLMLL